MEYFKKNGFVHELTKEAKSLSFTVEATVSTVAIENIIVSALEGASAYWCGIDNTTPEWDNEPEDLPTAQYATQLLLEGKSINLFDIEDDDEQWSLDLPKLLQGIGKAMSADYDIWEDVDEVLQLALFGELVYG